MRIILILSLFFISVFSLSLEESKHLLNRTSFGYTQADLKYFKTLSKEEAVNYLITQASKKEIVDKPLNIKNVSTFAGKFKDLSKEEKKNLRKKANKKMLEIRTWWYKMMINSKYSFRERMTLFWHNHFTSEYKVVKSPYMMFEQNMLYRNNALGNFAKLLEKSSKDLAMLVYLDNNSNRKSHANENYARELLELFTLGEGNYSEEDIKEAARAFTGYRVNKKDAKLKKVKKHHDEGLKVFMGYVGNLDSDDIIEIILKQKNVSKFITMKLYIEFVSEKLDINELDRLAEIFRKSNYEISVLMKSILLSDNFWDLSNRGNMIKSPVEMIVSFIKNLNLDINEKDYKLINRYAKNLGQDLFNPPNVKGWQGGKAWIDTNSLVNRNEFINILINKKVKNKIIKELELEDFTDFSNYFYALEVDEKLPFKNRKIEFKNLLSKPIYQLK